MKYLDKNGLEYLLTMIRDEAMVNATIKRLEEEISDVQQQQKFQLEDNRVKFSFADTSRVEAIQKQGGIEVKTYLMPDGRVVFVPQDTRIQEYEAYLKNEMKNEIDLKNQFQISKNKSEIVSQDLIDNILLSSYTTKY